VRAALGELLQHPAVKTLEYVGVDALIGLANRLGIPWEQEIGSWKLEVGEAEPASSIQTLARVSSLQALASNLQPPNSARAHPGRRRGAAARPHGSLRGVRQRREAGISFAISRIETLDGKVLVDYLQTNADAPIRKPQSRSAALGGL